MIGKLTNRRRRQLCSGWHWCFVDGVSKDDDRLYKDGNRYMLTLPTNNLIAVIARDGSYTSYLDHDNIYQDIQRY